MRILLLSNGPSLATFDGDMIPFDVVIGVTRAATVHPCHWWVVGDDDVYESFPDLKGLPMWVFACKDISIHKGPNYLREARAWLKTRYVLKWADVPNARQTSGVAGLALAHYLIRAADPSEPHTVDVYGVDLRGDVDCRGVRNDHRGDDRWEREKRAWDALLEGVREDADVRVH